jgi:hypothetical protein
MVIPPKVSDHGDEQESPPILSTVMQGMTSPQAALLGKQILAGITDGALAYATAMRSVPTPAQMGQHAQTEYKAQQQQAASKEVKRRNYSQKQAGRAARASWAHIPKPLTVGRINKAVVQTLNSTRYSYSTNTGSILEVNATWRLADHPQYTSWTALFDQYCILKAELKYISTQNSVVVEIHSAIDYDDSGTLGSITLIDSFNTVKVVALLGSHSFTRTVFPTIKTDVEGTSGVGVQQVWLDQADATVIHYGHRLIVPATSSSVTFTEEVRVWYAFRNGY